MTSSLFKLSTKALVLLGMLALGVPANPVGFDTRSPAANVTVNNAGVQCGNAVCPKGYVCCNPTCNMCTKPDMACTQQVCDVEQQPKPKPITPPIRDAKPKADKCGRLFCSFGQQCCNDSCEICTPPGVGCIKKLCLPSELPALGVKCGKGRCATNQVCCNDSCGICTAPGDSCITLFCESSE
ncbi:hypothetical protein QBC38DRAFT_398861 [Podospora fimiseda]|uniref:Uncharacterized protein n=1 Tax=Podospora fimiseda TaxID=252190 RepID=A0AAN7BIF0_9PEZI|nr:hypothetical protein QBC38DRAFT_398861 [Podospora fimiseda]